MFFRTLCALLVALPAALAQHHFTIKNNCPASITLFINGESQGNLAVGASTARDLPQNWSGFIYTSANGGNGQTGAGTTRAGFFLESNYYYIVVDPAHFNTGVSIFPALPPRQGKCLTASCDSLTCSAFQQPPTRFPPPSTAAPPALPLYECFGGDTAYTVTFCPSGTFPSDGGMQIHPNGNTAKCLDVRGAAFANGTPVQIYDCNGTPAQRWSLTAGNTKVKLTGTNFCLDAGSKPANGVGMKIWQCYDNLPAQAWYYTGDKRIAVAGQGQCLDLTSGSLTNGNQVQTWQCTTGNTNQIWNV